MTYDDWEKKILERSALTDEIRAFRASHDARWFVDRHVLGDGKLLPEFDDYDSIRGVCRAALKLFQEWDQAALGWEQVDVLIARPKLMIDDDFLDRTGHCTPPHVQIMLAKHAKYLTPFEVLKVGEAKFPPVLEELLAGTGLCREHAYNEDGGCWYIWDSYVPEC